MTQAWEYIGHSTGSTPFPIDGIDVWQHDWSAVPGGRARVKDPAYGQEFQFTVWSIKVDGKRIEFAAGEFSNGVWGFYRPRA